MANEVTKAAPNAAPIKPKTIASMLNPSDGQPSPWAVELKKVLPSDRDVGRFMAVALNQLADPKNGTRLAACTTSSFYSCLMKSARSGILPDGVNGYLIAYGKECTLQFSYRGLCDMAIREGIATRFKADIVYSNDEFVWENGELVRHVPAGWDEEDRGDIVGAWVGADLGHGEWVYERMSLKEIEDVRKCSQNPNGVWAKWWGEMAKKSVLKRLFKTMRNTPALSQAINDDNENYNPNGVKRNAKGVQGVDFGDDEDDAEQKSEAIEAEVVK